MHPSSGGSGKSEGVLSNFRPEDELETPWPKEVDGREWSGVWGTGKSMLSRGNRMCSGCEERLQGGVLLQHGVSRGEVW